MKTNSFTQMLKFTLFSISAGIIQVLAFTLLNELLRWPYWPAYLIALVLSILWNFTFNRRYTFQSAANVPVAMIKLFGFYAVFTPLSTKLEHLLADTMLWNGYLVTAINMALNLITEFLYQRFYVFRDSIDTNDLAKKERGEL